MRGGSALVESQRTEVIRTYEREKAKGDKADQTLLSNLRSIHTDCLAAFDGIDRNYTAA